MMKRIMITIAILATLTLTGCSLNNELSPFIPVEAAGNSETSTVSEVEEPTNSTSEVENESSTNNETVSSTTSTTESKPEEKPVESSSTSTIVEKPVESTSTTTEKPVASTSSTTSKVEKPVASSSSTSSKPASSSTSSKVEKPVASSSTSSTTSKPVEKPVASSSSSTSTTTSKPVEKVHNCSTDGHVWEVTTTTTEPKWCRERHEVIDNGYDVTLASRYLGVDDGTAYYIFIDNMEAIGVDAAFGSASINVEVWGTESFETKTCKFCNHSEAQVGKGTITPMGEWRYVNGVNLRWSANDRFNFNTLFYDPYNVPQVVIYNINAYWEIALG